MKYAGLTNDLKERKEDHGNLTDWRKRSFLTEKAARDWEKAMPAKPRYKRNLGARMEIWIYLYY